MTAMLSTTEIITSVFVSVRMDVEPNNVVHTSPERFVFGEKMFMRRYPNASAEVEMSARLVSPLIFEFCFPHKSMIAKMVVTGRIKYVGVVIFKTDAKAKAPNAVWLSPSPMNENLFKTSVTPRSEEHNAMTTPVITAYWTKEN